MTNTRTLAALTAFTSFLFLSACSTTPTKPGSAAQIVDLASATLPAVAAEFTTTRNGEDREHRHDHEEHEPASAPVSVTWRFWRDSQQLTIERPQLGMGEAWQRDGQSIIHRELYHRDQRAIEFQDDDLRMLQSTPSWQKLALLFDRQILEQLEAGDIEWSDGYPTRDYQGTVGETTWHIVMRMDLALPILIEREQQGFSERTELLSAYPLENAPWHPTSVQGYDIIDFADLGDKEYDPFVARVLSRMGHSHAH